MNSKENLENISIKSGSDELMDDEDLDELTDEENAAVDEAVKMLNKDAEKTDGVFILDLRTPLVYNGNEYKSLTFEFKKLKGTDSINIEDELIAKSHNVFMNDTANTRYLITMAARACVEKVPYNGLLELGIIDFNRIKNKARLFLLGVAV